MTTKNKQFVCNEILVVYIKLNQLNTG